MPVRTYRIAAIQGGCKRRRRHQGAETCAGRDGGFEVAFEHFDWGSERYKKTGAFMPENGLDLIKGHDAILFGSAGAPDVPDHITLWGLRLAICQPFDQYANVRPTRILPGITSPLRNVSGPELDWVIVRENSEGEYAGVGGRVHRGLPEEVATDVSIFTRTGVERIMRFAFALARSRPRKLLTVVTKSNAQRHAMVMWDEIAAEVAAGYPDVRWDKMLVDAMTMRMTLRPETLDTIVASNLHADILSDLAAALAGSLGIAPTANLNPERKFPSMFEPIHGSAFDIAGKGIANPIGTFWSGVMMLEHLGERAAAARLMRAIERVTADASLHTPDLGGRPPPRGDNAVCEALLGTICIAAGLAQSEQRLCARWRPTGTAPQRARVSRRTTCTRRDRPVLSANRIASTETGASNKAPELEMLTMQHRTDLPPRMTMRAGSDVSSLGAPRRSASAA
jgi:tartrate dehydrogenase/decarboxylase/D-malate dehydrogenase